MNKSIQNYKNTSNQKNNSNYIPIEEQDISNLQTKLTVESEYDNNITENTFDQNESPIIETQDDEQLEDQLYQKKENSKLKSNITDQAIDNPNFYSKRRWLILICLGFLGITNTSSFVTFSVNVQAAQTYYGGVSESSIIWFSNIYYIVFVIFCLPASFLWKWRFDGSMFIAAIINMAGGWMRVIAGQDYYLTLLGAALAGTTQVLTLPATVIIPEIWFPNSERVLATSITYGCFVLGTSYGYLSAAYMVNGESNNIPSYLLFCAIVMSIPFILMIFLVRNPQPYDQPLKSKKLELKDSLRACCMQIKNFISINSLAIYLGMAWIFQATLNTMLKNYSTLQIGYMGLFMSLSGVISGLATSILLSKQVKNKKIPKYDFFIKTFATIAFVLVITITIVLELAPDCNKIYIFLITACIGLGFNAFVPIAAQSMLETIYPVSEIIGYMIFNLSASILALIGTILSQVGLWLVCLLMVPFYVYIVFIYKTDLKRLKNENKSLFKIKQNSQIESQLQES